MQAGGMQHQPRLTVVGRSTTGRPRTYRVERTMAARHLDAFPSLAYRRLTATILGLDVASLAHQLRSSRTHRPDFLLAA